MLVGASNTLFSDKIAKIVCSTRTKRSNLMFCEKHSEFDFFLL